MKILKDVISDNLYIQECDSTTFSVLFNDHDRHKNMTFVLALIKYPEWSPNVDIFQYLDNSTMNQIRDDELCFFVFDASTEGFSPFQGTYFFDILYSNCKEYGIPANKIIFTSSNLKDNQNLKRYNKKNKIKQSINIFTFLSFRRMINDLYEISYNNKSLKKHYSSIKKQVDKSYSGKFLLSLSRVNRPYRSAATCLLSHHPLGKTAKISHNFIEDDSKLPSIHTISKMTGMHHLIVRKWVNSLPLIVDTDDFKTNHALYLNPQLHHDTLFQIVNETHVDNFKNTSLFYSEKTFRSMIHFHPFVIYGQQGCNRYLEKLGFKLYTDWIDYEFDDEPDPIIRYNKLLKSLSDSYNKIKNLSKTEQIEWRFKNPDVLLHNANLILDKSYDKQNFERLFKALRGK